MRRAGLDSWIELKFNLVQILRFSDMDIIFSAVVLLECKFWLPRSAGGGVRAWTRGLSSNLSFKAI